MKRIIGLFLVALIPLYVSAGPDNIAPAAKVKSLARTRMGYPTEYRSHPFV